MDIFDAILILGAGLFAGFVNTLAGGGSVLTLPALIFVGLPSVEANATNRVAIIFQSIFAVTGFKSKGVHNFRYGLMLAIAATGGAVIGARLALEVNDETFNRILAVVMVLVVVSIIKPFSGHTHSTELLTTKHKFLAVITFFFIGIYGGFIQVGVGFLIMAALSLINNFGLVKTNSIKVFVTLIFSLAALLIFTLDGQVNWKYGFVLAAGNAAGGWFGSRWSVGAGEKWIKAVLIVMVAVMAVKLFFFS